MWGRGQDMVIARLTRAKSVVSTTQPGTQVPLQQASPVHTRWLSHTLTSRACQAAHGMAPSGRPRVTTGLMWCALHTHTPSRGDLFNRWLSSFFASCTLHRCHPHFYLTSFLFLDIYRALYIQPELFTWVACRPAGQSGHRGHATLARKAAQR